MEIKGILFFKRGILVDLWLRRILHGGNVPGSILASNLYCRGGCGSFSVPLLCYIHTHTHQAHTITLSHTQHPTITSPNHKHTCNPTPTVSASALTPYIHFLSLKTSVWPHPHLPVYRTISSLNMFLTSPPLACILAPPSSLNRNPEEWNFICVVSGGHRLGLSNDSFLVTFTLWGGQMERESRAALGETNTRGKCTSVQMVV